jgi:tRNA pseudouridine synthase 10
MKPVLCKECASRFSSKFPSAKEGECHICGGALSKLPELLEKAKSQMKEEWKTFSLSTAIPKKMLAKEEEVWDYSKGESLKSWLNFTLSKALEKSTKKDYRPNGADGRIIIDFNSLTAVNAFEPIFIFGRYKKLQAGLCQSRWECAECGGRGCAACKGEGRNYESIEEIIGDSFRSQTDGKYYLHASGREDVDVLNFAGRPFVLEIKSPKTSVVDIQAAADKINSGGKVEVLDLKRVSPGAVELVADSHFPKTYRAWIEDANPADEKEHFTRGDLSKLLKFDNILDQRTPLRVSHRRADKIRQRRAQVTSASLEEGKLVVDIRADAGTYIKELIHGDQGRTNPSFSSLLGKKCICTRLDVIKIEDDFLKLLLG